MNEKLSNNSIQQLRENLKIAEKANNESEVLRIENEIRKLELGENQNQSENSNKEQGNENREENLEKETIKESEILKNHQEKISNLSNELGGEKGVKEVFDKMSPEEKAQLEQKITETKEKIKQKIYTLKEGKVGNINDDLWDISKCMMDFPFMWQELKETWGYVPVLNETLASAMFIKGAALSALAGPMKGIQQIVRKIKLGFEKRNLRALESKLV